MADERNNERRGGNQDGAREDAARGGNSNMQAMADERNNERRGGNQDGAREDGARGGNNAQGRVSLSFRIREGVYSL